MHILFLTAGYSGAYKTQNVYCSRHQCCEGQEYIIRYVILPCTNLKWFIRHRLFALYCSILTPGSCVRTCNPGNISLAPFNVIGQRKGSETYSRHQPYVGLAQHQTNIGSMMNVSWKSVIKERLYKPK